LGWTAVGGGGGGGRGYRRPLQVGWKVEGLTNSRDRSEKSGVAVNFQNAYGLFLSVWLRICRMLKAFYAERSRDLRLFFFQISITLNLYCTLEIFFFKKKISRV